MIYQGKITKIDDDGQHWAEVADLAVDQAFPCRSIGGPYIPGTFVLVVNIDGAQEDLVIVGGFNNGEIVGTDFYDIGEDTDGVPYYFLDDDGDIFLDTDGVPYYA